MKLRDFHQILNKNAIIEEMPEFIESLPLIIILNTTSTENIQLFLKSFYNSQELSWMKTRTLIERYLAPFLSSYLLTGKRYFYNLAIDIAQQILYISKGNIYNCQLINLKDKKCKTKIFETRSSYSDAAAGYLEMYSLYFLTHNELYKKAAESIISNSLKIHGFHDISLARNIHVAHKYFNVPIPPEFNISQIDIKISPKFIPLLETDFYFKNKRKLEKVFKDLVENNSILSQFNFDPLILRMLRYKGYFDVVDHIDGIFMKTTDDFSVKAFNILLFQKEFDEIYQNIVFNPRGHMIYVSS